MGKLDKLKIDDLLEVLRLVREHLSEPKTLKRFRKKFEEDGINPNKPVEEQEGFFEWAVTGDIGEAIADQVGMKNTVENHAKLWSKIREHDDHPKIEKFRAKLYSIMSDD